MTKLTSLSSNNINAHEDLLSNNLEFTLSNYPIKDQILNKSDRNFKQPSKKFSKVGVMSVKNLDVFKFIEAVKAESFLYDKNNAEYRNADKRQQTWSQIAIQFGFSDEKDVYKKWKYLKDHFFAEKKKMNQRGVNEETDYKKWQYFDALKWTEQYLDKRKSRLTDDQIENNSLRSTPTPTNNTTFINGLGELSRHQYENGSNRHPEQNTTNAFHSLSSHMNNNLEKKLILDDKESEIEALLYRPFDSVCSNINTTTTLNGLTSSKQQYQQLHQALIAESEEELFGRLVARDLVRLPANLRPLARLKIQELLYHFSIGHIPEMH